MSDDLSALPGLVIQAAAVYAQKLLSKFSLNSRSTELAFNTIK
jgi:hypothetical protein